MSFLLFPRSEEASAEGEYRRGQRDHGEEGDAADPAPPPGLSTPGSESFVGVDRLEEHQNPGTLKGHKDARKALARAAQHFPLRYNESMPVEPAVKVEALSRDFRSQRRLADALGVSPAQVSRWKRGQGIDPDNAERLDLLELVMSALLRLYEPSTAEKWLFGLNPFLRQRRPIDVIRQGRVEELLAAIRQEQAGSFA